MLKKLVKQASVTFKVRLNFLYFTLLKNIPPITYYLPIFQTSLKLSLFAEKQACISRFVPCTLHY